MVVIHLYFRELSFLEIMKSFSSFYTQWKCFSFNQKQNFIRKSLEIHFEYWGNRPKVPFIDFESRSDGRLQSGCKHCCGSDL